MELTLIRHADVERNADGTMLADPPLSERGRRQLELLDAASERWPTPTAILVSATLRTRQTAEPLLRRFGLSPVAAPWLEEMRVPGESHETFEARVSVGLFAALEAHGASTAKRRWSVLDERARLLLVGHGGSNALIVELLLGIEPVSWSGYRFPFAHTAVARLKAYRLADGWVFGLLKLNHTGHLPRELRSY